ncbi:hypothetical protein AK830_g4366 [Neonectria ditissima]|uniref:DUF676 domain-containing protein n=1 Tax=Neonectria ditissima TaxID=78410 RepID=A0A0P7BP16_9HYPO|nr:hypothetical protein AK830_g4366 [Neonectria ditissima]
MRLVDTISKRFKSKMENQVRDGLQQRQIHVEEDTQSQVRTAASTPWNEDGIKLLHGCPEAQVDVIFVHGLSGNRDSTWTGCGRQTPWPTTLLPSKIKRARILTYGYDAYSIRSPMASKNRLTDHAANLLTDIAAERQQSGISHRPFIFVAHSLGGLVCKEAILLSRNNPELHLREVFEYTKGIAFMSTPHRGSWIADWAKIPVSVLGLMKSTNTSLLAILSTDDQFLESVQLRFWAMIRELRESGRHIEVTCFFEELPMPRFGKIVSKESATLEGYTSISIHADHRNMVKFSSEDETGFKRLVGELSRWKSQIETGSETEVISRTSKDEPDEDEQPMGEGLSTQHAFHNYATGSINVHTGAGSQHNNNGPGNQFNGPIHEFHMPSPR